MVHYGDPGLVRYVDPNQRLVVRYADPRHDEQPHEKDLKSSRSLWLKNPENLSEKQKKKLNSLTSLNLKTAKAYQMRLIFQRIFTNDNVSFNREEKLAEWYKWAIRSRIDAIVSFARTLKKHWEGITRWFYSRITNGILEGLNSLVQMAKSRARGFRSVEYFKLIIYRVAGDYGYLPT